MDAETQIDQATALHAIATLINKELNQSGPEDWETGILVLRPRDAEDEEVGQWLSAVWNPEGETGRLNLDFDALPTLNAYRAATLAGSEKRWVCCLIEFHRSGKLRTRFEHEDADGWWKLPEEHSDDYITRMRPKFDIPS